MLFSQEDLEEARKFFYEDHYAAQQTGCILEEVGECYAKCSVEIQRHHLNGLGGVMGGVMFTLADFTFAVSSNFKKSPVVSINSQISFLSAPKGKKLISESKLIKDGRSTCLYEINITDETGRAVAFATFTGMKLEK